ncbi:MAG: hypothetical protein ACI9BW_003262 [Gammaproteobacteria bacterium]
MTDADAAEREKKERLQREVAEARAKIAVRKEAAQKRRAEQRKRDAMQRAIDAFSKKWEREYDLKHGG